MVHVNVSVLNREPMGMKPGNPDPDRRRTEHVSVLNREPMGMKRRATPPPHR